MRKRVLCFLIAVCTVIPMIFTGCGGGDVESKGSRKPVTVTLYGITGESTTEEAVKLVQDAMNEYTEGQYNTHVELHLYSEDEYYSVLDAKFAEADAEKERLKEEAKNKKKNGEKKSEKAADDGNSSVYPAEKNGQVDIFMVRGAGKLGYYYDKNRLSDLTDTLSASSGGVAKILNSYISKNMFTTVTFGGKTNADGTIENGSVYGIPNNNICGEYTYLLVNKELAAKYYYSAEDVSTLDTLTYYLDDVNTNDKEYITLYNEPLLATASVTDEPSLIGGIISNNTLWYQSTRPRDMMTLGNFGNFYSTLYKFRKAGYIGGNNDYYADLPEGEKIAAAFLKGDPSLPERYSDEYLVINYQMPVADAGEYPGTVYCVGAGTVDVNRSMEIIAALQTEPTFRNLFQYGVEDVHYSVDEFTDVINVTGSDYSMNPSDTGNMFILRINSGMDEQTLKYAENDWALAKQQYRDTIVGPYCKFSLREITKDNFTETSYVYEEALNKAKKKQGDSFDAEKFASEYKYEYRYTDEMLDRMTEISRNIFELLDNFEEYEDENGNTVDIKTYISSVLKPMLEEDECYAALIDQKNADSPYSQYMAWFEGVDPTA